MVLDTKVVLNIKFTEDEIHELLRGFSEIIWNIRELFWTFTISFLL